jgi:hypothetical protein
VREGPDAHAPGAESAHGLEVAVRRRQVPGDRRGPRDHELPGLGEADPARGPLQQARARLALELRNRTRDGRLREVEGARRGRERAALRDLAEHLHPTWIEHDRKVEED